MERATLSLSLVLYALDVAHGYDTFEFTKLNPIKSEDRGIVDAQWDWEKPILIDGKVCKHENGKVFQILNYSLVLYRSMFAV